MTTFIEAWDRCHVTKFIDEQNIESEIIQLISEVYDAVNSKELDLLKVKESLIKLLTYLSTPQGRTDANCWATNLFFCIGEGWKWDQLPKQYREITFDIGGTLHDTVSNPKIASNFESLPEQLLERVQKLSI